MSDFGAYISIEKKDGKAFTSSEKNQIKNTLQSIIENDELVNALGDPYEHEVQDTNDSKTTVFVQLSEHYYGGDEKEDEEIFDFVKDAEEEDTNFISKKLENELPQFNISSGVTEW